MHEPTSSAQTHVLDNLGPPDKKLLRKTTGLNPSNKNRLALAGQLVLNYLFAKFETFQDRKQPDMGNTGESIAYVKKTKMRTSAASKLLFKA